MSQYLKILSDLEADLLAAGLLVHEVNAVMGPFMDLTSDAAVSYELRHAMNRLREKQRECLAAYPVMRAYFHLRPVLD